MQIADAIAQTDLGTLGVPIEQRLVVRADRVLLQMFDEVMKHRDLILHLCHPSTNFLSEFLSLMTRLSNQPVEHNRGFNELGQRFFLLLQASLGTVGRSRQICARGSEPTSRRLHVLAKRRSLDRAAWSKWASRLGREGLRPEWIVSAEQGQVSPGV